MITYSVERVMAEELMDADAIELIEEMRDELIELLKTHNELPHQFDFTLIDHTKYSEPPQNKIELVARKREF